MESPKPRAKHVRDPPPSLFLGPPSQNASHVSLSATLQAPPLNTAHSSNFLPSSPARPAPRQRSQRIMRSTTFDASPDTAPGSTLPRTALPRQQQASEGQKQADRTDALWAEMQSTLEEVELSAVNGLHVFGPEHSRALEALRTAQIALAQAWARSEAEDGEEGSKGLGKGIGLGSEGRTGSMFEGTDGRSTAQSGSGKGKGSERPGSSGAGAGSAARMGDKLEEETEADIAYARKRREENDRYFQKVNKGVLDVVAKLEDVATAMKSVELETRDIWGENESAATSVRE